MVEHGAGDVFEEAVAGVTAELHVLIEQQDLLVAIGDAEGGVAWRMAVGGDGAERGHPRVEGLEARMARRMPRGIGNSRHEALAQLRQLRTPVPPRDWFVYFPPA